MLNKHLKYNEKIFLEYLSELEYKRSDKVAIVEH